MASVWCSFASCLSYLSNMLSTLLDLSWIMADALTSVLYLTRWSWNCPDFLNYAVSYWIADKRRPIYTQPGCWKEGQDQLTEFDQIPVWLPSSSLLKTIILNFECVFKEITWTIWIYKLIAHFILPCALLCSECGRILDESYCSSLKFNTLENAEISNVRSNKDWKCSYNPG